MAPKRSRSSSGPFDARRFVSHEALKRYKNSVIKRNGILEIGILITRGSIPHFIIERGWQKLTAKPDATVLLVVREFYADAYEHENCRAFVRGKQVAFDQATSNSYYSLPNIDDDECNTYFSEDLDWEEVMTALCKPRTQWKLSGDEALSFPNSAMTRELKVWHYFIGAKLMPIMHVSDVINDRVGRTIICNKNEEIN